MSSRFRFACILAAGLLACSDDGPAGPSAGDQRDEALLKILRLAATSPPLWNPEVTFWAKQGQGAEIGIYFQDPQGQKGEKFVELDLDGESLLEYPDGTPFTPGDSVLITMRVVDATKLLVEFEPAGLRFNPVKPAQLEFRYRFADDDFNEDGTVNATDDQIELILGIWRQATPGAPFVRLGTLRIEQLEELDADLLGFSRFAIAY